MKYMGSKKRIWKYIAPIILENRKEGQLYVEPFCGGCNSISQVDGRRMAGDNNPYLISMLKSVIASEQQIYPISRQIYEEVRKDYNNEDYSRYTIADMGWVGFMASYNGRFFDGGFSGTCGKRNYIDESIRNLLQQVDNLKDVEFHCCSYESLPIPDGSIVYLDPPYKDTKQYKSSIGFDYEYFYHWAEELSKRNNRVFISEYWMPPFFKEIWSMEIPCNINIEKNKRVEKLFTI